MAFWNNTGYSGYGLCHEGISNPLVEQQALAHHFDKSKEGSGSQSALPLPEQLKSTILPIASCPNNTP